MLQVPRRAHLSGSFTSAQKWGADEYQRIWQHDDVGSSKYFLSRMLGTALEKATAKAARIETQRELVVAAIALSREPHEFWFAIGDLQVEVNGERKHVAAVEDLITGERRPVEWGGLHLRIDPVRDPAVLFRCLA